MPINVALQIERSRDPSRIVFGLKTDQDGQPQKDAEQAFAVPRNVLKEGHIHVRGRTRSGKTSLAIAPLLKQLIQPYPYYGANGNVLVPHMQDPIFVFDLGGDLSLFNFVKSLCKNHYEDDQGKVIAPQRKFRFLSLKETDDWDYFDPFQLVPGGERDVIRLAQLMIEAFNQDYGMVYGASYYSMKSLSALLRVANHVVEQGQAGSIMNFKDVGRYLNQSKDRDEASIRMAFEFLMKYDQVQTPPPDAPHRREINMRQALDNSEVIYFFCPSMGQATTARQIAGLGLYTLLAAAQLRKDDGDNRGAQNRHAWVIVDEFHELAGRSFASLLAQSSKFGISLILANQTTTQLETRDMNLAQVVRDNTLAKVYFTVTGKNDFDDLQGFSHEELLAIPGTSLTRKDAFDESVTESFRNQYAPLLKRNEILSTSSTGKNFFLILDDGSGHREPLRLFSDYAITEQQFHNFKNEPIPRRDDLHSDHSMVSSHPDENTDLELADSIPSSVPVTTKKHNNELLPLLQEKKRQEQPEYVKQFYSSQAM